MSTFSSLNSPVVNPASSIFIQLDDLEALAANAAVKFCFEEGSTVSGITTRDVIEKTLDRYMEQTNYNEKAKASYKASITNKLVGLCANNRVELQRLGSKVDDDMKARWVVKRGASRKIRRSRYKKTRRSKKNARRC